VTGPPGRPRPAPAGCFVLVAGWPAAGKSTLARALAAELDLPLLAKDEIKEALMDGLGYPATVAQSRRLGRVATAAMLRVAQGCPGAVLEVDTSGPVDVRELAATLTRLLGTG
jgi:predicted kinase